MKIYLHHVSQQQKFASVKELLADQKKTLILFKSKQAMQQFKESLSIMDRMRLKIAFEGERELSAIVRDFQEGELTIFCSYHLWKDSIY